MSTEDFRERIGTAKADLLVGDDGRDLIIGKRGRDVLIGEGGDDRLEGDHGNDILRGGRGDDLLAGGRGADIFVYASLDELGLGRSRDTIRDFRASEGDLLDLSALDADPLQDGQQSFVLLDRAPVSGEAAGAVWFKKGVLNISTDADAQAEYQIVLSGVRTLSLDDLLL